MAATHSFAGSTPVSVSKLPVADLHLGFLNPASEFDSRREYMEETCFVKGRPRVLTEQCKTCIGRSGNLMHLRGGTLKAMVNGALEDGSQGIICHQTLSYGEHPEFGGALCRWFYDTYGPQNNFIRCIQRIGGFTEVEPPETS